MNLTQRNLFIALALAMFGAVAAAFMLEYGFGVLPCKMCWWQRFGHMGLAALALVSLARPCKTMWLGIAAVAGATLSVALWQTAAQQGWLPFPPGCAADANAVMASAEDLFASIDSVKIIPCDKETFHLLGLSLANWNVLLMGAVIALAQYGWRRGKRL
jgi:disulfide bond formation protein DsbB